MSNQINVALFDINKACQKKFNAIIIGKRNTGKSTIVQDILYHLGKTDIPRVCIFSGTEEANGFYKQFVPGTFIHNDSNVEQTLENILQGQRTLTAKIQMGKLSKDVDIRIAIVLDDVGYKKGTLKSEVVRQIFMNGRHYGIVMILACQYCMDPPVDIRTNTDYVFVMKQNSSVKNLYEQFFSGFNCVKDFKTVLDACTENYESFVLDNTMPSTDVSKVCFYFKALYGREFKIGSKEAWKYHSKWYMSEEERLLRKDKLKKEMVKNGSYKANIKGNSLVVRKN